LGCTLPEEKQESGLSVAADGPREHPDGENIRAFTRACDWWDEQIDHNLFAFALRAK
jgi:hypothetical protein